MQPSEQQAGDVASKRAWRAKASKLSGGSENPSFSRASVALMRYGLRCVVFIGLKGHQLPIATHRFRWADMGNSSHSFDEVTLSFTVGRNENRLNPVS